MLDYGSDYNYWQYDGYFFGYYFNSGGVDRYFNSVNSDGNTNMYYMLIKRNTSTNDFSMPNHGCKPMIAFRLLRLVWY